LLTRLLHHHWLARLLHHHRLTRLLHHHLLARLGLHLLRFTHHWLLIVLLLLGVSSSYLVTRYEGFFFVHYIVFITYIFLNLSYS
jgi:hypothetical protein